MTDWRPTRDFAMRVLAKDIARQEVLEVGGKIGGNSAQPILRPLASRYTATDLRGGRGVDVVCPAEGLIDRFGFSRFDVVLATEVVEHVRLWRAAFRNMMGVLKPNGLLVLTTRSPGYPYHGSPHDYWRYQVDDMQAIFAGWRLEACESDPRWPGIFVAARKTTDREPDLDSIALHSMALGRRAQDVTNWQVVLHRLRSPRRAAAWLVPERLKTPLRRIFDSASDAESAAR